MAINSSKVDEEQKEVLKSATIRRLFSYLKNYKRQVAVVLVVLAVTIAISTVNPLLLEYAIDVNIAQKDWRGLVALCVFMVVINLVYAAVGINESSSRLNGLNPAFIKFLSFVILGLCVAVAALIKVSRISTINYSVIAKEIEMDAILAVALGGNSLSGGKFNLPASILGAYVIQFLTTTLYKFNVKSEAISAYKAIVVIILVVISAPVVREKFASFSQKMKVRNAKEVG